MCFLTHYAFTTPDFTLRKDPDVHPIIPGVLFFHGDSVEETFDIYFEKLAGYLRNPDNDAKKKEFDYIMIADQGIYNQIYSQPKAFLFIEFAVKKFA